MGVKVMQSPFPRLKGRLNCEKSGERGCVIKIIVFLWSWGQGWLIQSNLKQLNNHNWIDFNSVSDSCMYEEKGK